MKGESHCTCDRARPETFALACPQHGEGTEFYREREALLRGRTAEGGQERVSEPVAHINLNENDAARVLANVCEKTNTTPEFWDQLAREFIEAAVTTEGGQEQWLLPRMSAPAAG